MMSRKPNFRKSFQLESLEIRNAPSHFGGLAHMAVAAHKVHAAAHVRHFSDSQATDRVNSTDKSGGVEQSPDKNVESSSDPSGIDTNPNDRSVVDPSGQR